MLTSSTHRIASRNTSAKAQYLLIRNTMTVYSYIVYEPWYILLLTQRLKEPALSKCVLSFSPHTRKHRHSTGPKQKSSGAPKKNAADNQIHQYLQPRCLITIIYDTLSHKSLGCLQKSIDEHFSSHTHTHTWTHILLHAHMHLRPPPINPEMLDYAQKHTTNTVMHYWWRVGRKKKETQNQNPEEKTWVFLFELKEGSECVCVCVCVCVHTCVHVHMCMCA